MCTTSGMPGVPKWFAKKSNFFNFYVKYRTKLLQLIKPVIELILM